MPANEAVKWNKRASIVYAVGVWTMLGSYGYYRYMHKDHPPAEGPAEEPEELKPNVIKFETTSTKTTVVYREDFVPYSTRVINFFKSFNDSSTSQSPATQSNEEQK